MIKLIRQKRKNIFCEYNIDLLFVGECHKIYRKSIHKGMKVIRKKSFRFFIKYLNYSRLRIFKEIMFYTIPSMFTQQDIIVLIGCFWIFCPNIPSKLLLSIDS